MPQPTTDEQIRFLLNIQRSLNEGHFTATNKYAVLLALADIAVETGDDSGAALAVPVERIAEKYMQYYWRQAIPCVITRGEVLQQNTYRLSAIVRYVIEARREHGDSLLDLQRRPGLARLARECHFRFLASAAMAFAARWRRGP